jgi:hypothetical protein
MLIETRWTQRKEAGVADELDGGRRRASRRTIARDERRARSAQKKTRRRNIYLIGGSILALALVLSLLLPSLPFATGTPSNSGNDTPRVNEDTPANIGTAVAILDALHIDPGELHTPYNSVPPTSGPHYFTPVNWGNYNEPIVDEFVVHNMEHGGVIISHNLTDEGQIDLLTEFVSNQPGYPGCLITRPYAEIAEGTIALTAWGWVQEFEGLDTDGMQLFIDSHKDRGPENLGPNCGG